MREEYFWSYERTRIQLRAMTYIAHAFKIHVGGCHMTKQETRSLIDGEAFPEPLLEGKSHGAWHPTDYIFNHQESAAAKDVKELDVVLGSIGEELINYVVEHTGPIAIPRMGRKRGRLSR